MEEKTTPKPELKSPVLIACSPWVTTGPTCHDRVVIRLVKNGEYAVHREMKADISSDDGEYYWGNYFTYGGRTPKNQALVRAWSKFVERANSHIASYVQLIKD